jgi:Cdc6-like AAA superfamily ATPase
MVRTLKNAFEADRIAQAFMLTGIRGTGKTTTARIIAKGLNCIGPDGTGGPTTDPCGVCENCKAIAEGRHVDVMEMDAASHTGVQNIRDAIIETVQLPRGAGALQDLHHRRGAHAVDKRVQRAAEDAGGTARPCEIPLRHDRDPQGAGHGPVALPALRPAPDRARGDDRASEIGIADKEGARSPKTRWRSSPAPPKARSATR